MTIIAMEFARMDIVFKSLILRVPMVLKFRMLMEAQYCIPLRAIIIVSDAFFAQKVMFMIPQLMAQLAS